jgi:hypothetical protein
MKLTKHFAASEMVVTGCPWKNEPEVAEWINLARLCCIVLEPLRVFAGPLRITSGYRNLRTNREVGGAKHSAHLYGRAADIIPMVPGLSALDLLLMLRDSDIPFDKAILEYRGRTPWLHVQVRDVMRDPRRALLMSLESGKFEKFNERDPRLDRWRQ